jgi:DNA ligase (NAD+)
MLFDLDRLSQLETEIKRHNDLYWKENAPEISDSEYDALIEELRSLNPASDLLKSVAPIEGDTKHYTPMLSLDKCYDEQGLLKWLKTAPTGAQIIVSPKIDGIACSLIYNEGGELVRASTRGDGSAGEEIPLTTISSFKTIPLKIPSQGRLIEVRGEVYMSLQAFGDNGEFKSPRNASAGALKRKTQLDQHEFGQRFFAYDVRLGSQATCLSHALQEAYAWGFTPVPHVLFQASESADLEAHYHKTSDERSTYDFDIDGVVYRIDDRKSYESMGATSHHPRGAIAYKLKGDVSTTYLRDIEWSVSKYGVLTPVAVVDPVFLNGAKVTRVTLHNLAQVREKKIHTLNAKVKICRRGGVIPHFEEVLEQGDTPVSFPTLCPICPNKGCQTREISGVLTCAGDKSCEPIAVQALNSFVKTTKIDGFGDVWLDKLISLGILKSPVDLFTLDESKLQGIEGVKEGRIKGWLTSIEKAKTMPLDVFLQSLSIHQLGKSSSKVLAEKYGSLEEILRLNEVGMSLWSQTASKLYHELHQIDGFGFIVAQEITQGLTEKKPLIESLLAHIKVVGAEKVEATSDKLQGKSFVFTGTLTSMSRSEAQKKVVELGGSCPSSVTKTTTYLVVGNEGKAGSKLAKAEKLGVSVISEDDFGGLLG